MMKRNPSLKAFVFSSLMVMGVTNSSAALPPPCSANFIPSFNSLSAVDWDAGAVRNTLHVFAYGGFATDEQVNTWADMAPQCAIQEMLSFQSTNDLLSPPGTDLVYDNVQAHLTSLNGDATLEALQDFWSSSDSDNPTPESEKNDYALITTASDTRMRINSLPMTWIGATNKRGVNPFRQKVGFWLTNEHMAVHMTAVGNNPAIVRKLYDDVMRLLSQDAEGDNVDYFANILSEGAKSPVISAQYGHRANKYTGTTFKGNDDFAREYHQLFFGVLGDGSSQSQEDYENITVENTAKLLTGMNVIKNTSNFNTSVGYYDDEIDYISSNHYPDTLENLEILDTIIPSSTYPTAMDKLDFLSQVALNNQESLDNLPVWIATHFADDTLNSENDADDKVIDIRTAWQGSDKNLLHFLRSYAISDQFHAVDTYSGIPRFKYRNAFDRNMTIYNQATVDNEESYINVAMNPKVRMESQGAQAFLPSHFVFGTQTGVEAVNNPNIFKSAYNENIKNVYALGTSKIDAWEKQWSKLLPADLADANGKYKVSNVGAWLWARFIGDGNSNYGYQERFFVSGLLAKGNSFSPVSGYEEYELNPDDPLANSDAVLELSNNEGADISVDNNKNIGLAISFITVTPYMFVQNNSTQGQGE